METNFDKPLEQKIGTITEVTTPTITASNSAVTNFGHNSFIKNGIMYVRGFFKAGALSDQTTILTISGYTAVKRSEGILVTKIQSAVEPIYIAEGSNAIQINSNHSATTDNWTFVMIDILVE